MGDMCKWKMNHEEEEEEEEEEEKNESKWFGKQQ
jgi:hypothetical protein